MKSAKTQSDTNMNFDGMEKIAPKHSTKYQTNHWSGHMNDGRLVNYGRGPTVGNKSDKDASYPGAASMPSSTKIKNPDYINGGAQVRTPGGTRAWDPVCGQNYKGNADSINVGRGPTKGNQK